MKTEVKIRLSSIEDVRNFVELVRQFEGDIDLSSGRYVVDAKSIMGIFSLDLSKNLTLIIISSDTNEIDRVKAAVKPFAV
jgi:phosphotransferase system HPr-like phosphotransfer protein